LKPVALFIALLVLVAAAPAPAPQRVLSGSLASDEIALALLTRAKAPERLIAVSTLADDPLYSNIAPVPAAIKARFAADLEGALALRPDLVILASFNKPETLARFKDAKVKTLVLGDFFSFADIEAHIREIGAALGVPDAAAGLAKDMQAALAAVPVPAGKRPTVLDFHQGGSVSGKGTLFEALVTAAGAEDLAASKGFKGWPSLSAETLATLAPDVVVAAGEEGERAAIQAQIAAAPGWKSMRTAKTARLILIPERLLSATSQHVVDGVVMLNKKLFTKP
jgi:iron complex transport system substrate-binding protein